MSQITDDDIKDARAWLDEGRIDAARMGHHGVWGALRKLHHEAIAAAYEDAAKIGEAIAEQFDPNDQGEYWIVMQLVAAIRSRAKERQS